MFVLPRSRKWEGPKENDVAGACKCTDPKHRLHFVYKLSKLRGHLAQKVSIGYKRRNS